MHKKGDDLLNEEILYIFKNNQKRKFNYKQILFKLKRKVNSDELKKSLYLLEKKNKLKQINSGSYILLENKKTIQGVFDKTKKGSGYLIQENIEKDFFISEKNTNKAFDGDLVECELISNREAKIINILERRKINFVGTVSFKENTPFVVVSSQKDKLSFIVNNKEKAKEKEIVVIEFNKWEKEFPEGKIIKIIGEKGIVENEIHAILEEYELPYEFSEELNNEATKLELLHTESEIKKRKDLRNITTITIDPEDAKDFDDAISVNKNNNNLTEIGVHIADVSFFLKKNTLLDKEAFKRATSVYLVDRVVPMLPESLSNKLCSLRPNEDKFTFSAVFTFDNNNQIINEWFGKTVINSNKRLTYEETQYVIVNKSSVIPKEISLSKKEQTLKKNITESIEILNKIANNLREKRKKEGSISFNKKEVKFILNKTKEPTNTILKESLDANKLVEEFMLLANRRVAGVFEKNKKTKGIYRIHDYPDDQKIATLERVVKNLGYNQQIKHSNNIHHQINSLLKQVNNTPEQNLIDTLVIRSMSKAKYSSNNIGHFGLAFKKYTHFTSPIRRYPDVIVHRMLENILKHTPTEYKNIEEDCLYCSKREEVATKAERTSIKYMQVKYMSKQINKRFVGIISGIMERGIFVETKKSKCEGFIRIKEIPNDYFIFNEKEFLLYGRNTKEEYRLGDEVLIKVIGTNEDKKQIDFALIEKL
jgi:ribonuclease R|tara:strand:+ start:30150 stop:32273 length:2124 start_codon:yes stop_codon:yes gene_type:complete